MSRPKNEVFSKSSSNGQSKDRFRESLGTLLVPSGQTRSSSPSNNVAANGL